MPNTLFIAIPDRTFLWQIAGRVGAYFDDVKLFYIYECASNWLESCNDEQPFDIAIIHWVPELADTGLQICRLVNERLSPISRVIILDGPDLFRQMFELEQKPYQVELISKHQFLTKDWVTWLDLAETDHFIRVGRLLLRPAMRRLEIITDPDKPETWEVINALTELRVSLLEYLMREAAGAHNHKQGREILSAVWGESRPEFVNLVHDAIRQVRTIIEPDTEPRFLKSIKKGPGKKSGYYIETEMGEPPVVKR